MEERKEALLKDITEIEYEDMRKCSELPKVAEGQEFISFSDAVQQFGEDDFAVWQCQEHFSTTTMHFLCGHPEYVERFAIGHNTQSSLQLGLCAASDECCTLKIVEVPCFSEWRFHEDAGLETLFFV